jgi:hypothetical protein
MKWEEIKNDTPSQFKRLVGVTPSTFRAMVKEIKRDGRIKKKKRTKRGRPFKLSVEDQVLMTLMYWREYRSLYHTGRDYGISESVACRTIQRIENKLSRSDKFKLPGKKQLTKTKWEYEVFLVDATENPIERPKKNRNGIIRGSGKGTR